jgi:uncharacterized protein YbjT (DUF2867 family)
MPESARPVVAIAGATGFVGSHLIPTLTDVARVVALARTPRANDAQVEWRSCDLFSSTSTRAALEGVDVVVYLVHSMMPSARLFQGTFHDTDLLLADNVARAAAQCGVQRIIYLGGLAPAAGFVSAHLQSRLEVEEVLASSGVPVTCLRAGMVVGPGGTSFEILRALVERLPWMILPAWTRRAGAVVFLDDIVAVLRGAITDPAFTGRTFDVVTGEPLTYETLLRLTAEALGRRRLMIPVPITSTGFSKRWVQLFSGASYELVAPLIDSLQCDLPQHPPAPEIAPYIRYRTFAQMLAETLRRTPAVAQVPPPRTRPARASTVQSIQRLPSLPHLDARVISNEYMSWLPHFLRAFLRVARDPGTQRITFSFALLPWPLLVLEFVDQGPERLRDKFHIVGGVLTRTTTTGWFEFRQVANRRFTLASIHGFVPALPWAVYVCTQAPIHAWVMRRFGRHLGRLARARDAATSVGSRA